MSVPAIRENYQRTISAPLEQLNTDESLLTDITSIEKRLTDVTNLLQTCAERSIPKFLKPYWKQGLKPMHDRCRYYRKIWILQGRPRDSENRYFMTYKQTERDFRRELRRKAHEYESQEYERLESVFDVDNDAFQRVMSKKRKSRGIKSTALKIDGKFVSDPDELREIWKEHYTQLYTPVANSNFDEMFTAHVESSIYKYERESKNASYDALDNAFAIEEVSLVCVQLPNGKCLGPDDLTYEHIKYGCPSIMSSLTAILNAVRNIEIMPSSLALGDIISLFKTNKKIRHDKDNYRGTTLLNVIGKIFERLILDRYMDAVPSRKRFSKQFTICISASKKLFRCQHVFARSCFIQYRER
jgi:hypothetical protein